MERELRVQLPDVGRGLATIAREPLAFLDGRIGSAGVAVLRWREAVGGAASSLLVMPKLHTSSVSDSGVRSSQQPAGCCAEKRIDTWSLAGVAC